MKKENQAQILKIVWISLIINVLLMTLKLSFGYIYGSPSLISDGYNSLTDILVSVGLVITVKISSKAADKNHPYGHQKFEGVMLLFLSLFVAVTGFIIAYDAIINLVKGSTIIPSFEVIIVSIITIILKVFVSYINLRGAKKLVSPLLKADSINHLSDIPVSVVVLISVSLSFFLPFYVEYIASIIIAIFILNTAFKLFRECLSYIVDEAPDKATVKSIREAIKSVSGVISVDDLKTRKHVTNIYVDTEIGVDETLSLKEAHDISEKVHSHVEKTFPQVLHIMVHVNPTKKVKRDENNKTI